MTKLLYANLGLPQLDGTLNGVRNQLWEIHDNDIANKVTEMMGTKPIYIADGHHRYTTALQYQKEMEAAERRASAAESPGQLLHVRARRDAG